MDFMDPVTVVRAFYLLSAATVILLRISSPLKDRFVNYGARNLQPNRSTDDQKTRQESNNLTQLLNYLAAIQVPHNWFKHFYFLSTCCSAFWLWQVWTRGTAFHFLEQYIKTQAPSVLNDASYSKAIICLIFMSIQGLRRLSECLMYTKPSQSTMGIGHYILGLAFYSFVNVAVWIEQAPSILLIPNAKLESVRYLWRPTVVDVVAINIFLYASICQHDYHAYLSSLRKYTLPDKWAFRSIVAPHYTAECAIYASLAILSARDIDYVNWTVMTVLIFTISGLGVMADGTKDWMKTKFVDRRQDIEKRWKMIPWLW